MNKNLFVCSILFVMVILTQDLSATDLSTLIETVKKQNPEILKIKEKIESAKAKAKKVQALPDPMVEIGLGKSEGMSEYSLMIQQAFSYPGKLALMGEVEKRRLKMLEVELSAITLNKVAQTKKDYYELFLVNKGIEITNRTKEHLKHIEGIANTMYATGMLPQTDILRIQTEISMQTEKLTMLEAKKEQVIYRMMWSDLGLPLDSPKLEVIFSSEFIPAELKNFEELQRVVLKDSPMLKMAEYGIEMQGKEVELAKKEFKPDFVSSAEVMDSGDWGVRFGIMYPLYKDKKQKNVLIETEANLSATKRGYEQERLELSFMLKENYLMAGSTLQNLNLYKSVIIPQLNLTFTSALSNYKTGKIDFLMLFDNLMRLQEGELRYYELLKEYEQAVAEIERLIGGE